MKVIEITTCNICMNMCPYCPQDTLAKQNIGFMHLNTFKQCLNNIPVDVGITFSGFTEPFLNPKTSTMMKIAYDNGHAILLHTTLVGMKHSDIDIIEKIKLHNVSFHLPDKERYMRCTVDDHYCSVAKRMQSLFPKADAHVMGSKHPKLIPIFTQGIHVKEFKQLHSRANNVNYNVTNITDKTLTRKRGKIRCDVVRREKMNGVEFNVLLPNGNVALCCMDYGCKHIIGNLLTDQYEDLFKSKEYNRIMQGMDDETIDILCRTCSEAVEI